MNDIEVTVYDVNYLPDYVEAEEERQANEAIRISNENTRIANEATRVSNESTRTSAESSRVTAEQGRVSAEAIRVSNENARIAAEEEREELIDSLATVATTGKYSDLIDEPTKVSDFTNDSGFITNTVDDLTNYYKKTETYSKNETNNLLNNKVDNSALDNYYEISEVDGFLNNKADVSIVDKKPYYFDNVASMKAYNLKNGDYVITKGYYQSDDGGSAEYLIINGSNITANEFDLITLDNNLIAKLINDKKNILCYGVSKTDENNNNHIIINSILERFKYARCNTDIILKNTLEITSDNVKFDFLKITYTGEDEAIIINGQSILLNGSTIISSGEGLRIGKTNLTHNGNIEINRISAENNSIIMGGTSGVLNCSLHINRLEYKEHGILFDLTDSYVGQISLYNTIFADNSSLTENYAIYMDCSDYGMTGLDIYNISLEGAKGGIYVTTSGTTTSKFLEHLNVYGCRLTEFSTTNNHKALKLVSPSGGLDVEGEFHFDKALTSAFDFSEYNSWGQQFYKIEGKFMNRTLSSHQVGQSSIIGKEGTIRGGKLEICNPYYEYSSQNAGNISDFIIPTSRNLVLSGTATPNIKFNNSDYALTGLYTIYINSANITTLNLINSTGSVIKSYTVESGDTIMIYSNFSGGCQLNSWLIRPSYMNNAN